LYLLTSVDSGVKTATHKQQDNINHLSRLYKQSGFLINLSA